MPTSKLSAIAQCKCPRCRRGKMFYGKIYSLKQHMNEHCPHCGLKFEIEPGYFYAAMYVSYALNVAEMVTVGVGTYVLTHRLEFEDMWLYFATILTGCVVLAPFNFRYSRVILLHWLSPKVHYNAGYDIDKP
ncbi:DUF983 domain-containing protein [Hufsiella ginkgonis]|uniref:DUF983 domain-containing protein n=1 Tax=Hufsiella ginkgonis TaxID=2695274 RepID=A0A7K1Y3D1_9SPHI|nr:DUF983 domain-containing protein [Hufsiella ginkgonis]MXV17618.1 DUF983 domain-containing protein [Hufsiella ginkgonis]